MLFHSSPQMKKDLETYSLNKNLKFEAEAKNIPES